jgi:hypothetical protein
MPALVLRAGGHPILERCQRDAYRAEQRGMSRATNPDVSTANSNGRSGYRLAPSVSQEVSDQPRYQPHDDANNDDRECNCIQTEPPIPFYFQVIAPRVWQGAAPVSPSCWFADTTSPIRAYKRRHAQPVELLTDVGSSGRIVAGQAERPLCPHGGRPSCWRRFHTKTSRLLIPHLLSVQLPSGTALAESGVEVDHAYFPLSGAVSLLVVMRDGKNIETGTVGREGETMRERMSVT